MMTFDKIDEVLKELELVQANEKDQRDDARKCKIFTTKKNGQWEDDVWQTLSNQGRPRYTYDRTSPILDAIVGELEQNEFSASVTPTGGKESTKETADLLDGLLRSIQGWSDAGFTYKKIARNLTSYGFDACRVVHDYRDDDSFDQDLIINYIPNAIDRVWFDQGSEKQDRSDANWVVVLQGITKEKYDEKWPKGSGESVPTGDIDYYTNGKRELVVVGEILYKKRTEKTIVQMNNGNVYDAKDVDGNEDRLAEQGELEVRRRTRPDITVWSRFFDGDGFLEEEKKTVFTILPIAPFYNGFEIVEDKITWRRMVENMMDPQRVFNYAVSRQVEEGALAPRSKIMMTSKQAKGHERQLANMNTSAAPVQFYEVDDKAPPPYQLLGPQANPSLQITAAEASTNIQEVGGMFANNLGNSVGVQSGVAIELLQQKGDTGNSGFYLDMAIGITGLCKIIIDGAPGVYDTTREVVISNADGSIDIKKLNENIPNSDGVKTLNNLNGQFTVNCSMGPMFKNRQGQANSALLEVAPIMPGVIEGSADIFLRNIDAPGIDKVADRARQQLLAQGKIPQDQMTEEELEAQAAAQQAAANQPPDPIVMQTMQTLGAQQQEAMAKAQQAQAKAQSDGLAAQAKLMAEMNKQREQDRKDALAQQDMNLKTQQAQDAHNKTMAETLDIIRQAMGADSIIGPNNTAAYKDQAEKLHDGIEKS